LPRPTKSFIKAILVQRAKARGSPAILRVENKC
jgi:hypothetical protein